MRLAVDGSMPSTSASADVDIAAALGDELQRLGLLRGDVAGARALPPEATERTGHDLQRARGLGVGHSGHDTNPQGLRAGVKRRGRAREAHGA